jgi:hypothetical protein
MIFIQLMLHVLADDKSLTTKCRLQEPTDDEKPEKQSLDTVMT